MARQFCRQRLADPKAFDRRSFRTETLPRGHRLVIGCPKGRWQAKGKRCSVGTRAQSLLHPMTEGKCPPGKFEMRKSKGQTEGLGLHLPGEAIILRDKFGADLIYQRGHGRLIRLRFGSIDAAWNRARRLGLAVEAEVKCR